MSLIILSSIIAGDTAATIEPIIAASSSVISKNIDPKSIITINSNNASTNDNNSAGLPIFFRSLRSRDNPASIKMTMSENCLSSAEMFKIEPSTKSKT